jgi:predicted ABC-class ATPase
MKRTKKITEALKAIASGLPKQEYHYLATQKENGADLIQRGILEDGDKKPVLPNKDYLKKIAIKNEVNHINRMKSAYDAGGVEAVKKYLRPFLKPELQVDFFDRLQKTLA